MIWRERKVQHRPTPDKEKRRRWAIEEGDKVLWQDERGLWHAVSGYQHVPYYSKQVEDVTGFTLTF
jgi:hypothetical protein